MSKPIDVPPFPDHIPGTARQFKARKRAEMKRAIETVDALQLGCAYMPRGAGAKVVDAVRALEEARKACLEWWRDA